MDIFYDQSSSASLSNKIELEQYNLALATTQIITGSSCDKLNQELGLKYLHQNSWGTWLCLLYKTLSTEHQSYISNCFHKWEIILDTQIFLLYFFAELNTSRIRFFLFAMNKRNKLDPHGRSFGSIFLNALSKFLTLIERKIFNINDPFIRAY